MVKRNLIKAGNSLALTFSRDMRQHLNLQDEQVTVEFVEGGILIKAPISLDKAAQMTEQRYGEALTNLSK